MLVRSAPGCSARSARKTRGRTFTSAPRSCSSPRGSWSTARCARPRPTRTDCWASAARRATAASCSPRFPWPSCGAGTSRSAPGTDGIRLELAPESVPHSRVTNWLAGLGREPVVLESHWADVGQRRVQSGLVAPEQQRNGLAPGVASCQESLSVQPLHLQRVELRLTAGVALRLMVFVVAPCRCPESVDSVGAAGDQAALYRQQANEHTQGTPCMPEPRARHAGQRAGCACKSARPGARIALPQVLLQHVRRHLAFGRTSGMRMPRPAHRSPLGAPALRRQQCRHGLAHITR